MCKNALPNIITRHAKAEIIDGTSNIFLFDLFLAIYNCCFCCFSSSVFFPALSRVSLRGEFVWVQ